MRELTQVEIDAIPHRESYVLRGPTITIDGRRVDYKHDSLVFTNDHLYVGQGTIPESMAKTIKGLGEGDHIRATLADLTIWQKYVGAKRTVRLEMDFITVGGLGLVNAYDCSIQWMKMEDVSNGMAHTTWSGVFLIEKVHPMRMFEK